jgi:class 3 adenylate cyclase
LDKLPVNVLIVDDNPENIELVKDILDMAGYQSLTAEDGKTALDMVDMKHPDLILLDVNMPQLSGFDVCRRLKSQPETRNIPVIMLTAQADVDSRVKGLAAGADDYLTKPFSPRELMARVERSLRSKAASDELRVHQEQLRNTFERFVAAPVVEQLLENPEQVKLGGRLQPVTVLFADLEGFTTLSERTEPEALLQLLNSYHTLLVNIILQYGGTIDKFLGDGVMALYNTPVQQDDHISRAVKSALHIQDELHWFWQKLPEAHRLQINFGIHSGEAVVGNVGTEDLMDFTAVGDAVNVAARLQDIAQDGQILVTEPVYDATRNFIFGRSRGDLPVKGRENTVRTYRVSNTYFED